MIFTAIFDGYVIERRQTMHNKSITLALHHKNKNFRIHINYENNKASVLPPSLSILQETRTVFPVVMEKSQYPPLVVTPSSLRYISSLVSAGNSGMEPRGTEVEKHFLQRAILISICLIKIKLNLCMCSREGKFWRHELRCGFPSYYSAHVKEKKIHFCLLCFSMEKGFRVGKCLLT